MVVRACRLLSSGSAFLSSKSAVDLANFNPYQIKCTYVYVACQHVFTIVFHRLVQIEVDDTPKSDMASW